MILRDLFIIDIIFHFIVLWRWIKWISPEKTNTHRILLTLIHIVIFITYGVVIFFHVHVSDPFLFSWFDPLTFLIAWMFCEFFHLVLIWGMIEYGIYMDQRKKKMEELFPETINEVPEQSSNTNN